MRPVDGGATQAMIAEGTTWLLPKPTKRAPTVSSTRIEHAEQSSLEAVRKFLDTVDSVFPDLSEDGPRRKIIDSAFKMTEQLVGSSNRTGTEHPRRDGEGAERVRSEVWGA